MTGYTAPREGGAHQPARTPMRVADGWTPTMDGMSPPSVPKRRAVIPQPFRRPSTELSLPHDRRRVWRYVPAEEVMIGDTVVDIGVVLDCVGTPVIGCTYQEGLFLCWLEDGHEGDHMDLHEARAAGQLCIPGMYWTLVGPEVEREYGPNQMVRAFQLEEGR